MKDTTRELTAKYHADLYGRYPVTLVEGNGAYVTDSDGKTYLDALAGIAVNCLGYGHPRHVSAIQEQARKLIHTSNFFIQSHRPSLQNC